MLRLGDVTAFAVHEPYRLRGLFGLLPEQLETRSGEQIIASVFAAWEGGRGN